jgi:hypothetical protein
MTVGIESSVAFSNSTVTFLRQAALAANYKPTLRSGQVFIATSPLSDHPEAKASTPPFLFTAETGGMLKIYPNTALS